jgi:hypothetical protein
MMLKWELRQNLGSAKTFASLRVMGSRLSAKYFARKTLTSTPFLHAKTLTSNG